MGTVEAWAVRRGYDYRLIDDAGFLGAVPCWYRAKAGPVIQPVADLARVEVALRFLRAGVPAVAWVDADVLVFRDGLVLPEIGDVAFTREVWLEVQRPAGAPYCVERVNNCIVVAGDVSFLESYRAACLRIAHTTPGPLSRAAVGTDHLTELHRHRPFALVRHVGNLSPQLLRAIVDADERVLSCYRAGVGEPLLAANLCASFENKDHFGILNTTAHYEQVVDGLLTTDGAVL
jgi:hypothetical protein